jgi:hypothetical protein
MLEKLGSTVVPVYLSFVDYLDLFKVVENSVLQKLNQGTFGKYDVGRVPVKHT